MWSFRIQEPKVKVHQSLSSSWQLSITLTSHFVLVAVPTRQYRSIDRSRIRQLGDHSHFRFSSTHALSPHIAYATTTTKSGEETTNKINVKYVGSRYRQKRHGDITTRKSSCAAAEKHIPQSRTEKITKERKKKKKKKGTPFVSSINLVRVPVPVHRPVHRSFKS